jgi:hypothetical protein
MDEKIQHLVKEFKPYGIVKGVEFLLPPDKAVLLVDKLAKYDVMIYGCDLWRFLDPGKNPKRIVALLGAGMLVDDPKPPEVETAKRNAELVKDFIQFHLPDDAELISLIFADLEIDSLFRQ